MVTNQSDPQQEGWEELYPQRLEGVLHAEPQRDDPAARGGQQL